MFEQFKKNWRDFLDAPPGKRFRWNYRERQSRRNSLLSRILFMGGGIIITLAGIFFLPAPGPGTVIIFIGLGMIAQESLWLSMALDKVEVYLRKMYDRIKTLWENSFLWIKITILLLTLLIAALIAYGLYMIFLS